MRIAILNGQFKCTREAFFSRKISRSIWDSRNTVHFAWRSNPLFSGCMTGEFSKKKDQNSFFRIAILNGQFKCTHWGALSRKISRSVWASSKVAHFAWRWFGQEFSIWLHILAWYCLRSDCSPLSNYWNRNFKMRVRSVTANIDSSCVATPTMLCNIETRLHMLSKWRLYF